MATGRGITAPSRIEAIAATMGSDRELEFQRGRPADVMRHRGDLSGSREVIDCEPRRSFDVGMRNTARWYESTMREPVAR